MSLVSDVEGVVVMFGYHIINRSGRRRPSLIPSVLNRGKVPDFSCTASMLFL